VREEGGAEGGLTVAEPVLVLALARPGDLEPPLLLFLEARPCDDPGRLRAAVRDLRGRRVAANVLPVVGVDAHETRRSTRLRGTAGALVRVVQPRLVVVAVDNDMGVV